MKKLFFLIPIILGIIYLTISWTLSSRILLPESSMAITEQRIATKWGTSLKAVMAPLPVAKEFSFVSFDGIKLKGKYFNKKIDANCAIILSHGWTSNWAGMLKYVPVLEDCPCDLILYDLRAHGQSEGRYATGGINEAKDLLILTDWVKKNKGYTAQQIGWLGASWGAATVLTAGAESEDVAFIIADSPFEDWYSAIFDRALIEYGAAINWMSFGVMKLVNWRAGIDHQKASASLAAQAIEEPVLLIHSRTDKETYVSHSEQIAQRFKADNLTLHLTDWGGDHTEDVLINKDKFKTVVNDFLKKANPIFLNP